MLQTKVYDCLSDYYDYQPLRVPIIIYATKDNTVCNDTSGCPRPDGSLVTQKNYIVYDTLSGWADYGENYPTKSSSLMADEHEMTHYFLNEMLHSIPIWFDEAVYGWNNL